MQDNISIEASTSTTASQNENETELKQYPKVKVLLVDDHEMMRSGLRKLINSEGDLTVIAEASDGIEALETVKKEVPDIIVMDVDMPRMNGIEATHKIHSEMPSIPIIGLSLHDDISVSDSMIRAGAVAYISKSEAFSTLCRTIKEVLPTAS